MEGKRAKGCRRKSEFGIRPSANADGATRAGSAQAHNFSLNRRSQVEVDKMHGGSAPGSECNKMRVGLMTALTVNKQRGRRIWGEENSEHTTTTPSDYARKA
jgi:hypothetical protein